MYCENYTFNQISPIVDNRRTCIHEYAKQQLLLAAKEPERLRGLAGYAHCSAVTTSKHTQANITIDRHHECMMSINITAT